MHGLGSPHRRTRAGLWFATFTIASLLMLLASRTEPAQTLQAVTTRALDPLRGAIAGVGQGVAGIFGTIGEIDRLRSENDRLQRELSGAEQRIAELTEAARRLPGTTGALKRDPPRAPIPRRAPPNFRGGGGIDAGPADGVQAGMPV